MTPEIEKLIKDVNNTTPARKLTALIEKANISADVKAIMADVANVTLKVAGKVLAVGRKIVGFIFDIIKTVPTISLAILTALVISAFIASIPLIGGMLSAFLTPIMMAAGITTGALKDFTNAKLQERIDNLIGSFSALKEV